MMISVYATLMVAAVSALVSGVMCAVTAYFAGYDRGVIKGEENVLSCCHYRRRIMRDILETPSSKKVDGE